MKPVTLRLVRGDTSRELTPEDLAVPLGASPAAIRGALLGLLLAPTPKAPSPEENPRARGSDGSYVNVHVDVNGTDGNGAQENILSENVNVNVPEPASQKHEDLREDAVALAKQLAEQLGDPASLPWYRQVVETLDPVLVRDALFRARTMPAHQIRKSRAAYFAHIVAPFMRSERQARYARAPSPSP